LESFDLRVKAQSLERLHVCDVVGGATHRKDKNVGRQCKPLTIMM
jgi:hypothetical protein